MWQFDVAPFWRLFPQFHLAWIREISIPGSYVSNGSGSLRRSRTEGLSGKTLQTLEMGIKKANWKAAAKEMAKRVCLFTACQISCSRPKHLSHQLDEKISPLHAVTPSATRRPLHRGWMNNGQMSRKCQMFRGCGMFRISTFCAGFDAKFDAESLEKK